MPLALTRKLGESFSVGVAVVTITRIKNRQVRVSIQAPKEIKVVRSELKGVTKK